MTVALEHVMPRPHPRFELPWILFASALAATACAGADDATQPSRAEECGGLGAPCCLTFPENPAGSQFTCDVGYTCVAEVCELPDTGPVVYYPAVLASSVAADGAPHDPTLIEPWFVDATGALAIGDRGYGTVTLRDLLAAGATVIADGLRPTGGVRYLGDDLSAADGTPAGYLWADEGGRVYAGAADGSSPPAALFDASGDGARYTGLAVRPSSDDGGDWLYAVDAANGWIDVWRGAGERAERADGFRLPDLDDGWGPYGIAQIDGALWVAFVAGAAAEPIDPTRGRIGIFDGDGRLVQELDRAEVLAAPWGMARAPDAGFGDRNGCVIVANRGSGQLHTWCRDDADRVSYRGPLRGEDGAALVIEGAHGLAFSTTDGPDQAAFVTARRPLGGAVHIIQWGPVGGRPTPRTCLCRCELGDDASWIQPINVFASDLTFPSVCLSACASHGQGGEPSPTCVWAGP